MYQDQTNGMDTATGFRELTTLAYQMIEPYGTLPKILVGDTYLGTIATITTNSFVGASFPTNVLVVISVPGLTNYSHTDDAGYRYVWPVPVMTTNSPPDMETNNILPGYPDELTTNGLVILNSVWGQATNRVRFTIGAGGVTNVYTQFGDKIKPAMFSWTNGASLAISATRGADLTVISSTNLLDWSDETTVVVTNISGLSGTNQFVIPIDPSSPESFFRVRSD